MKPGVMFSDLRFKYSVMTLRIMTLSRTGGTDANEDGIVVDWDTERRGHITIIIVGGKIRDEQTNRHAMMVHIRFLWDSY